MRGVREEAGRRQPEDLPREGKRRFKPNLQRIKVAEGGETVRKRVCVQCIRSGRVQRPVKVKPFSTVQV